MEYRKKWAANWSDVKYCSSACKRTKGCEEAKEFILKTLREQRISALMTDDVLANVWAHFCSHRWAAHSSDHFADGGANDQTRKANAAVMRSREEIRKAARLLFAEQHIEIFASGKLITDSNFSGAISLRLKRMR